MNMIRDTFTIIGFEILASEFKGRKEKYYASK